MYNKNFSHIKTGHYTYLNCSALSDSKKIKTNKICENIVYDTIITSANIFLEMIERVKQAFIVYYPWIYVMFSQSEFRSYFNN